MDNTGSERSNSLRPRDQALYIELDKQLLQFGKEKHVLPGIRSAASRDVFVRQLIDSIRRVKYVSNICERDVSENRADPTSGYFDPLKAAILFKRKGRIDEAFWLVFLFVHFGKNLHNGWRLAGSIYGSLGNGEHWTWERTSSNTEDFKQWLANCYPVLKAAGIAGSFGNHRKYRTVNPESSKNTGVVIESYINWVGPERSHELLIQRANDEVGNGSREMFDYLYNSMSDVIDFGRLAKFDFLTMVAKLGLASIEPGSTYMQGSTGPVKGARLLFGEGTHAGINCSTLEERLVNIEADLSLGKMGMQVLEDALCNWQKTPEEYKLFRG